MAQHENIARLTRGMAAFAAKDLAVLKELIAEDIVWHHTGTSCIAGDYVGIDEIFSHFAKRAALSGDTYRVHVEQAIACDEFVSVISRTRAKHDDGRTYEDVMCSVYRVANGKVVEAWINPGSPEREAEFYG